VGAEAAEYLQVPPGFQRKRSQCLGAVGRAGEVQRGFALEHEVGISCGRAGDVPDRLGGDAEREVRDHARIGGDDLVEEVVRDHLDAAGEALARGSSKRGVDLDRDDARTRGRECGGEHAATGPDLHHEVAGPWIDVRDEARREFATA